MKANSDQKIFQESLSSPIGYWNIYADNEGITAINFSADTPFPSTKGNSITQAACIQLREYFDNKRKDFELPLSLSGYTEFYQSVWKELQELKYGQMTSYGAIAKKLNNPKAVRAVGMANGKNPIPIIIPCHRVIGKDRSLTGYASGLAVKKWLLELEGAIAQTPELF